MKVTNTKREGVGGSAGLRRVTIDVIPELLDRYRGMAMAIPASSGESTEEVVTAAANAALASYWRAFENDNDDAADVWLAEFENAKEEYGSSPEAPAAESGQPFAGLASGVDVQLLPGIRRRLIRDAAQMAQRDEVWDDPAELANTILNSSVDCALNALKAGEGADGWSLTHWRKLARQYAGMHHGSEATEACGREAQPSALAESSASTSEGSGWFMVPVHASLYQPLRKFCESHAGGPHGRETADWLLCAAVNATVEAEIKALRGDPNCTRPTSIEAFRRIAGPEADNPPASSPSPGLSDPQSVAIVKPVWELLCRFAERFAAQHPEWDVMQLMSAIIHSGTLSILEGLGIDDDEPDTSTWPIYHPARLASGDLPRWAGEWFKNENAPAAGESGPEHKAVKTSIARPQGSKRGRGKQRRRSAGGAALAGA